MKCSRHEQILNIINGENVNIEELKRLSIDGCPDSNGIRSRVWKFLLNYLPCNFEKRQERVTFNRQQYVGYVKEFVFESCMADAMPADHPLNLEPDGNWITFFRDNEMLLQINKDCQRLCPDFDFFRRPTEFSCFSLFGKDVPVGVLRRRGETSTLQSHSLNKNLVGVTNMIRLSTYSPFQPNCRLSSGLVSQFEEDKMNCISECSLTSAYHEPHWEVIERILYVYYKTHVSQGYVQGMNEIIAPIYYVFATDPDESWRKYAEMDTFYCFNNLMTEIHPNFIRKLDGSHEAGLGGQMKILSNLLLKFDSNLSKHFQKIELVPEHFAFRWLSLLLAREFMLPDVLLLWDTLFSDPHRFNLLPYVCCSMLIGIRDQLLKADFPTAVQLVQNYPSNVDIMDILLKARAFYTNNGVDILSIYSSN
ncbi:TBC1 domain family member 13 [Schistosoma japonicum]|nr:TBC1 domain family member 13 [Schistosoma japonicum]KAH8853431.1 TBC1 domain family member 13 [Schistosoma japonicum]KAH8853432.1 TBC1 domain family member 13 [Schistosoma japonicum]